MPCPGQVRAQDTAVVKVLFPLGLLPPVSAPLLSGPGGTGAKQELSAWAGGLGSKAGCPWGQGCSQSPPGWIRAAGACLSITGEGRGQQEAGWLDRDGRDGLGASVPGSRGTTLQCSSWPLFMACPFPFSKLKMTVAVLIFLPTQGPVSVSLHLLSPLAKCLLAQRNCLQGFLGDSSQSDTSNCQEEKLSFYGSGFRGGGPVTLTDKGTDEQEKRFTYRCKHKRSGLITGDRRLYTQQ